MANRRESTSNPATRMGPPAKTMEGREQQLIAAAVDLAEQQILAGTASAQVITHYLKLGSTREQKEQTRLENENLLTQAKISQIANQEQTERRYAEALAAMSAYSGNGVVSRPEDEIDD